jgi:hypothetical protein
MGAVRTLSIRPPPTTGLDSRGARASPSGRSAEPPGRVTRSGMHHAVALAAEKVAAMERVSRADAQALWEHATDPELRRLSGLVRGRHHRTDRATWLIMAIINTTNVCVARCDYCAFYKFPGEEGTYTLSYEQLVDRIDAVVALGGQLWIGNMNALA